jgi:hypothetical protein
MSEVTYYRWSATVPLLVPLIAQFVYRDNPAIGLFDRVAIPLYLSGIAWPAYIPFAAALFWWLAGQPAARYRRVSWITPVLFLPPFLAYLLLVRWWTASTEPWAGVLIFYSIVVLLFGYGYVLLTHAGRRVLAWRGRALVA